jgi:hypothetical protein
MSRNRIQTYLSILVIGGIILIGCRAAPAEETAFPELIPTEPIDVNGDNRFEGIDVIYQWANEAEASSEFSIPEWSADQAIGKPDSPGCGDYQFAWASAASDSVDTLTVRFAELVYPLEINIFQSFNPDQISKVEVQDPENQGYYTVLQKNPVQISRPCPYELSIIVEEINFLVNTVRITVDQSQLGLGWNEIDAVQLIGEPGED